MTAQEFFKLCENHNWHYARTDDIKHFRVGLAAEIKLRNIAGKDKIFTSIFHDFYDWANKGKPKPELKNYIQKGVS